MYRRFLFLSVLSALVLPLFAVFALSAPARAQNVALAGFSEVEKIGFAFYHLSHHKPPFDDWIQAREDYKAATMRNRLLMTDEQRIRLNEGYLNYFPDRDLISLRLRAKITGEPNPDYKKDIGMQTAGLTHILHVEFVDLQEVPYIPVQVGKLWIGVIPDQLESVTTHFLTEAEFESLSKLRGFMNSDRPITVQMMLRPKSADAETPLMNKDLPVWLMMADIGALVFMNQDGSLAWEYAAEWYEYKRASSLMTLYAK